ncbi:NAD(P)H-hydrate epimerase [Saxibacter everestensis]|uniref:Bifunctional NAD(P)H-hydrate repair enzyme n=2 Tax=Saxibacter everestensis TaxID=2909229 RepID=A0ABY8QY93_9MICO|nr:NAD(P)H-hydrate epimerase [Brevibacteriaceae bacterium ZFBP1038]
MRRAWTPDQVRACETPLLDAGQGDALMSRAAAGLANVCATELRERYGHVYGSRVLALVGKGNNGGDALFAACRLARRGAHVTVLLCAGRAHPAGLRAVRALNIDVRELDESDDDVLRFLLCAHLVIDGIAGTGARAGLPDRLGELVRRWRGRKPGRQLVVAVDVPSGVDAGTGQTGGSAIAADVTVTFAGLKTGLLIPPAARNAGRVEVVDIGLELADEQAVVLAVEASDVAALWPAPEPSDHKYSRGVLGLVAGSARYPGAAVLAADAAVSAGVGMLRYVGPDTPGGLIAQRSPEVVAGAGRVQAWALGSGVAPDEESQVDAIRAALDEAIETQLPCVLDAGAFDLIYGPLGMPAILTPHAGELATLLGRLSGTIVSREEIEADPARHAKSVAEAANAVVLLKGAHTVISQPAGPDYVQGPATAWLATAGSGDVLTGVLGALAATAGRKSLPQLAELAALGSFVHGQAALLASQGGPLRSLHVAAAVKYAVTELRVRAREEKNVGQWQL